MSDLKEYARIVDGAPIEFRFMLEKPGSKAYLWTEVIREGEGTRVTEGMDGDVWRIVQSIAPPSQDDFTRAIQGHVDATARSRGYNDGVTCASYAPSGIWGAEAVAFVAWRDTVWQQALATLNDVSQGNIPAPTIEAFIAGLPAIEWPNP